MFEPEPSSRWKLAEAIDRLADIGYGKKELARRADVSRTTVYNFLDDPEGASRNVVKALYRGVSSIRADAVRRQEQKRVARWLHWIADQLEEGQLPGFSDQPDQTGVLSELADVLDGGVPDGDPEGTGE